MTNEQYNNYIIVMNSKLCYGKLNNRVQSLKKIYIIVID